jgi:hypothetical protein
MSTQPAVLNGNTYDAIQLADTTVNVHKLVAHLVRFVVRAGQVHEVMFHKPLVITSGNDGKHVAGSAHYRDEAVDLRAHDLGPAQQEVFLMVLVSLGQDERVAVFDERVNPDKQHWHCEVSG